MDVIPPRSSVWYFCDSDVVHLRGMNGHARDGEHALMARWTAEMLLTLVSDEGLFGLEGAVAIVAEDAGCGV